MVEECKQMGDSGDLNSNKNIFFASALSGITSRIILHPIDTIKSRIQVQTNESFYKNSFDAIKKIKMTEGHKGYYKGLGVSIPLTGFANALYLGGYEKFKDLYSNYFHNPNYVQFLSGFSAEAISCILWVPMDVLKERLQVQKEMNQSKAIFQNIQKQGIKALYKGYWITLGTFGPNSALYFLCYEFFKKNVFKDNVTFYNTLLAATFSNGIAAFITNPLDLIKVRYQVYPEKYTSFYNTFQMIYKYEGFGGFWKGVGPRLLYSAPNAGIIMMLFEFFKKI